MLGAFLLPIGFSSLRGLSHVLTCEEESGVPFTLVTEGDEGPTIVTSKVFERDESEGLCEGLVLDLKARKVSGDRIEMIVEITNTSSLPWKGSVALGVASQDVPVDIGTVPPGSTRTRVISLRPPVGQQDVAGTLFVGP